jgi:hypothetical protein
VGSFVAISALAQPVADSFVYPVYPVNDYYKAQELGTWNSTFKKYHVGEDWNGNGGGSTDMGDPVYSVANGVVLKIDKTTVKNSWGKYVYIEHVLPDGQKVWTLYAHLKDVSVSVGEIIEQGQKIGTIGDANGYYKDAAHLHFELRTAQPAMGVPGYGYLTKLSDVDFSSFADASDYLDIHRNSITLNFNNSGWFVINNNTEFDYLMSTATFKLNSELLDIFSATNLPYLWMYDKAAIYANNNCVALNANIFNTFIPSNAKTCMYFYVGGIKMTVFSDQFTDFDETDHQSQQDMIIFAKNDSNYNGVVGRSFVVEPNWTTDFELRYLKFYFKSNSTARLAHATSKTDESVRYVAKYNPETKTWSAWSKI